MEKEPEKIQFKLEGEESDSIEEAESEEEEPHTLVLRRSSREIRQPEKHSPPDFHSHFAMSITNDDPRNVKESVNSKDSDIRKNAMYEEMNSLDKNEAWNLVQLPAGRKFVGSK